MITYHQHVEQGSDAYIVDIPIERYHTKDGYISKSSLADILVCPAYYKYYQENPKPEKRHLNIGNCIHTLALEPDLFAERFFVMPNCDKRTKAGKDLYAAMQLEAGSRKIILSDDMETIACMAESLKNNKKALALLQSKGRVENSIYWEDADGKWKCRPDYLRDDGLVVDLKMTKSAYMPFFQKDSYNYHYDVSVALTARGYQALTGRPLENYVFLVVEEKPPYLIEAFDAFRPFNGMDSVHSIGERRLKKAIATLNRCKETGNWPSYHEEIVPLGVPFWALAEEEQEGESE